jgi:hypothetical protein
MRHLLAMAALTGLVLAGCAKEKANEAAEAAHPAAAGVPLPGAQSYAVEAPDSLRALASVPLDSAVALALARVPNGAIAKAELERENGALVWSFDIAVAGQEGISEVAVNALTGAVGAVEHEDAAAEAREAREYSGAAAKATKRP